jgi:hypothetical protein
MHYGCYKDQLFGLVIDGVPYVTILGVARAKHGHSQLRGSTTRKRVRPYTRFRQPREHHTASSEFAQFGDDYERATFHLISRALLRWQAVLRNRRGIAPTSVCTSHRAGRRMRSGIRSLMMLDLRSHTLTKMLGRVVGRHEKTLV